MICNKCKDNKVEKEFSFKNLKLRIRKKICKLCDKKYRKFYYQQKSVEAIKYSIETTKQIRNRNQRYIWDYLIDHPCVDCGEDDPIVLEFDHQHNKHMYLKNLKTVFVQDYILD